MPDRSLGMTYILSPLAHRSKWLSYQRELEDMGLELEMSATNYYQLCYW